MQPGAKIFGAKPHFLQHFFSSPNIFLYILRSFGVSILLSLKANLINLQIGFAANDVSWLSKSWAITLIPMKVPAHVIVSEQTCIKHNQTSYLRRLPKVKPATVLDSSGTPAQYCRAAIWVQPCTTYDMAEGIRTGSLMSSEKEYYMFIHFPLAFLFRTNLFRQRSTLHTTSEPTTKVISNMLCPGVVSCCRGTQEGRPLSRTPGDAQQQQKSSPRRSHHIAWSISGAYMSLPCIVYNIHTTYIHAYVAIPKFNWCICSCFWSLLPVVRLKMVINSSLEWGPYDLILWSLCQHRSLMGWLRSSRHRKEASSFVQIQIQSPHLRLLASCHPKEIVVEQKSARFLVEDKFIEWFTKLRSDTIWINQTNLI